MKFSCPKCAAKYQISDEKVKGRTVKMKCRKCGTTIPIRAEGSAKTPLASAPTVRADSLRPAPAKKAPAKKTAAKKAQVTRAPGAVAAPQARGATALKRTPSPAAPAVAPAPVVAAVAAKPEDFEWHAGIDGKSVGPMSVREMERRIGDGEINEETYVWRDGMDEWKPIPLVPELKPVLTRSLRPLAVPPPSMPAPAKAQAPAPVVLKAANEPAQAPLAAVAAAPAPSPTGPVVSDPVINEAPAPVAEAPAPAGWDQAMAGLGDEKKEAAAGATLGAGAGGFQEAPVPKIDLPSAHEARPHSYESLVMQLQKKRKNPLAVPFAVLAAAIFGIAFGFWLFGDQKTKIVKQIVEVPAKVGEAMNEEHQAVIAAETAKAPAPTDTKKVVATKKSNSNKSASPSGETTKSAGSSKPVAAKGLDGLQGLQGLGGPSAGPAGPSTNDGGGRPLSSSQIQSTVSKYRTSVKRGCWERALMMRDKNAPSSARVSVSITVAASGSVTGAKSGGDPKGYSGLSRCITQRVRGWKFPRGSGVTTVNVPFVFAAQ